MDNNMLKVMIVDDEEIARKLLMVCINWNEIGMEIVCEASGGSEALDFIEKYNPEIIFTDIKMHFMDGLEFSKIVTERYPHIKIVILTAYKEFDYAKKGIEIGVSDFLVKPINKKEVLNIALSIKENIISERSHWTEFEKIKKQLDENYEYMREKFIIELFGNSVSVNNLAEKMNYFYKSMIPKYYQIALLETYHYESVKEYGEEKRVILGLESINIIKQYFKENKFVDILFDNSRRIVILLYDTNTDINICCEQLKTLIMNRIKCNVSVGIGNMYNNYNLIGKAYREALEALKFSIVLGRDHITCFNDEMKLREQSLEINEEELKEIRFSIKAGLGDRAIEILTSIFSKISDSKNITIEQVRVISINIISAILGAISEIGLSYSEIYKTNELPYNHIFRKETLIEIKEYIRELIYSITKFINILRIGKSKKIVDDIIEYLKNNYSDNALSLSNTATKFYINPSYLSRIFKQETGECFSECLLKIRMKKAINLLNETNLKAYQIAEAVGIKDPYYFSNCFKKFLGKSINEYKKDRNLN